MLAVVALFAAAPVSAAESPLQWKFRVGETIRYEYMQKNDIKVKANGQETGNTTELTLRISWNVKNVAADGTAEIKMVVDQVQAKIQVAQQSISYDSKDEKAAEDPASKALDTVYRPAVGQEYSLKIDKRGQIVDATVPEAVTKALQGSPFMSVADGGSILSDKGLKNMFVQVMPTFPQTAVAKGGSWKSSIDLPVMPLKLSLACTNTLTSVEPDRAKIESQIDTSIKTEPNSPFTVEVKKQSGKGEFTLDNKAGHITESVIHQSIELNLGVMNRVIEQAINIDAKMSAMP
jgi:hypothetical protein